MKSCYFTFKNLYSKSPALFSITPQLVTFEVKRGLNPIHGELRKSSHPTLSVPNIRRSFFTPIPRNLTPQLSTLLLIRSASSNASLTHVDERGNASMVDVSKKEVTKRTAAAVGRVRLNDVAFEAVSKNSLGKGDVLTVAKVAGVMAAKRCAELIPLCHSLSLTNIDVQLTLNPDEKSVDIEATTSTADRTGVEMESLTAVAVAALTVYDMCKAVGRDTVISDVKLTSKSGGASGKYTAS